MKTVLLVSPEEAALARRLELRLVDLPASAGVLFAGVSVRPSQGGTPATYHVWVGCSRDLEEGTVEILVRHALRPELESGLFLTLEIHRGVIHASRTKAVDTRE